MKPQIALSPDQMHELQSPGLDCSDASMAWITTRVNDTRLALRPEATRLLDEHLLLKLEYAYTLEDILMKLPNTLEVGCSDSSDTRYYDLAIFPHWNSGLWCIKYKDRFGDLKSVTAKDIMKCAFEMFKWAIKNHPDKIK